MEVWSDSQTAWVPCHVKEAVLKPCTMEGYSIPAGAVKVGLARGREKWVMAESMEATLRRPGSAAAAGGGGYSSSRPPPAPAPGSPGCGPTCKNGCGRPVQPGLTRGMNFFDTCCKRCAQSGGAGEHDDNCGGAASTGTVSDVSSGPDPREWLEGLLRSEANLAKNSDGIFAALARDGFLGRTALKEAIGLILQPLGVILQADDDTVRRIIARDTAIVQNADGSIDARSFRLVYRQMVSWHLKAWFPKTLPCKTRSFVRRNNAPVASVYEFGDLLGEGSFGKVFRVKHKVSGEQRVCKMIALQRGRLRAWPCSITRT